MARKRDAGPVLLSGGNPQIAKADGDAPVQAYIAAMPGVVKAVRWNSPFYGIAGQGWFLSYHCFARYIKIAFFRGTSLHPVPPVASKDKEVRYVHLHEGDPIDEAGFADWVRQASALPGWVP
ncbi:DUF1801 domain-containing protein [Zavarzinia compransoris]|uniref:Histidine kinase n=1 Tax=Zavarzinia compransoris TaxID=1264899 RepID=A0A317DY56_9PROT|nr:DUF1801 domain-containing protein [Zavarzinia compransoris]PWR19667.1 histidine kinase [Zavarzinia compransoris]TDP43390.1 hypothetical protein DES42_11291 [Zavarzinia compransoris]